MDSSRFPQPGTEMQGTGNPGAPEPAPATQCRHFANQRPNPCAKYLTPERVVSVAIVVQLLLTVTPSWWYLNTGWYHEVYGPCVFLRPWSMFSSGFKGGFELGAFSNRIATYIAVAGWGVAVLMAGYGLLQLRAARSNPNGVSYRNKTRTAGLFFFVAGVISILATVSYITGSVVHSMIGDSNERGRLNSMVGAPFSLICGGGMLKASAMLKLLTSAARQDVMQTPNLPLQGVQQNSPAANQGTVPFA